MARIAADVIPTAATRTFLEWIEHDDGDTPGTSLPARTADVQDLHTRIACDPDYRSASFEPLAPPPGLCLAPLG